MHIPDIAKQFYESGTPPFLYPPPGRLLRQQKALQQIENAQFNFKTLEEAENISVLLCNCFPEPERVVRGLAELMFNAVEHGNLDIGYNLKAELCQLGLLKEEITMRLDSTDFKDRNANVVLSRRDGGIYVIITDQGKGFDWKGYLTTDPFRADTLSGRGIAMAGSVSFDSLTYNKEGNKAIGYVSDSSAFIC